MCVLFKESELFEEKLVNYYDRAPDRTLRDVVRYDRCEHM